VTFLALLEMTRLRLTRLYQDGPLEQIFIELSVSEDEATTNEGSAADDALNSAPVGGPVDEGREQEGRLESEGRLDESSDEDDGVPPDAER
jgi:hypothetical protein